MVCVRHMVQSLSLAKTREGNTPTGSLPLRRLITLGLAGQLGLDLDLVVETSTSPQYQGRYASN